VPAFPSQEREAQELAAAITSALPRSLSGVDAINEMRDGGSRHWRQMEWIGFWFEYFMATRVIPVTGGRAGPRYGRTTFDLHRDHVWDLKAHPDGGAGIILNDEDAMRTCIAEQGGLGYLIITGSAIYDVDQTFQDWHDRLKGEPTSYEKDRIARGAPSRRRKSAFLPRALTALWIPETDTMDEGMLQGWLRPFQKGMRNADGNPRRSKVQVLPSCVPADLILLREGL